MIGAAAGPSPTFELTLVNFENKDSADLLEWAQAGDAEAFGEICRRQETRLLRQALALCGNPSMAEDLAQDTLVEAWRCLHRYNGNCQFFTWLCAILLNRWRNAVRAKRPTPFSELASGDQQELDGLLAGIADPQLEPDEAAGRAEQAAAVRACLGSLSEKLQQVIYLRFFVDDSLAGIAAAAGCSVGTVKSRLFNALERLREIKAMRRETRPEEVKL